MASQRSACQAGSRPCTLKSCDNLFPSDKVRIWSLAQSEPTGDDVGQKLAQSFDSVGAKSTEPAEAVANAAAAVGHTELPVETANAVDTEQQAELTGMAAEAAEAVEYPEPTAPAVKAAEAVGLYKLQMQFIQ